MSDKARRAGTGQRRCVAATAAPGMVEKLLASAYREGSAEGDLGRDGDEGRRCATGLVVTRCIDESGNPVGYQLLRRDTA